MGKMKKNNKGFVLVETLVVTVFVAAVFSVIYINFYPLVGEYERRDFYDDLDSKYGAYWIKVFLQDDNYSFSSISTFLNSRGYDFFEGEDGSTFCGNFPVNSDDRNFCTTMWQRLHVNKVIVTNYQLDQNSSGIKNFKPIASSISEFGESFHAYIEFLPDYIVPSVNRAKYRVLVEFKRSTDSSEDAETYYTYANMEVVRW